MILKKAEEIEKYLKISRQTVTKIASLLPIFGLNQSKKSYVSTTQYLKFIEERIATITNGDFNSIKELAESHKLEILENNNLYKKNRKGATTIAFNNLKGGVAKTTTVANLAGILASLNQKVLLVDMDMQNQLSDYFTNETFENRSILNIIQQYDKTKDIDLQLLTEIIQTIPVGNDKTVDLLPSEWDLGRGLESARSITNVSILLKKILNRVKDKYDFILIDTPPTNIMALELSFFASDYITFVVNAEKKSVQSFDYLVGQLNKLQTDASEFNLDIKLDSIVLSKYKKTLATESWLEEIKEIAKKEDLLIYKIPLREIFARADIENLPLIAITERVEALETIEELSDYAINLINRK